MNEKKKDFDIIVADTKSTDVNFNVSEKLTSTKIIPKVKENDKDFITC